MRHPLDENSFTFVNYDGPRLPRDSNLRRLMRQRAMRDVALARKQQGDYGRHNLGQYPPSVKPEHLDLNLPSSSMAAPDNAILSYAQVETPAKHQQPKNRKQLSNDANFYYQYEDIPRPLMTSPGLEISQDFPLLLRFMPLTGLRLGIATFSHLTSDPSRTHDLFFSMAQLGNRKLLSFIPSRYGQASALSHATDCVVAALREMIHPPRSRLAMGGPKVLLQYNKALRALQAALDDPGQRMTAETLCATVLLGVFEVMNGKHGELSWIRHAGGAARLIELRGTGNFKTEFELALFVAHLGPTVMDAFLNDTSSFLTEERWQQVIRSAIAQDESLRDQKDPVFALWSHLVRGPKYFKEIVDLMFASIPPAQETIDNLIERLLKGIDRLLWWQRQAQSQISLSNTEVEERQDRPGLVWPKFASNEIGSAYVTQLALEGTNMMCYIFKTRLLFALAPSRFHDLELECQSLSCRILSLRDRSTKDEGGRLIWSMFMSQSIWIARGIVETREIWNEGWENREGMIERWKFEAWCKSIGRKFPRSTGNN